MRALNAELKFPETPDEFEKTSVAGGVNGVFGVAGSVPIASGSSSLIRVWPNGTNWKGLRVDAL